MKILIISGFLGSGKTTFIKEMVKKTKKQFVIVENEFGKLGLDGNLIKENFNNEEIKIWELTEGCICCSLNLDFTHSILTIANTINPEYLIVEPSGVAMLSNIIEQLSKICYENIVLLSPIVIIDANNFKNNLENYSEYFLDQLNNSSKVILSKSENLSEVEFSNIKNELEINRKLVNFNLTHYSNWTKQDWENLFNNEYSIKKDHKGELKVVFNKIEIDKEQILENISLLNIKIKNIPELIFKLNVLMSKQLGSIVRAKGYFNIKDFWFKFDLVNNNYEICGCNPMEDSRVVIIGKKLNKKYIYQIFNKNNFKKLNS